VPQIHERVSEPTAASTWFAASGGPITDALLEWPPDLFAVTNLVLVRAEAFRFAVSPVEEWPPSRHRDWAYEVEEAGRQWGAWAEDRTGALPDLVAKEWSVFLEYAETPLEQLASGQGSRACDALLTLHAIADEACAALGIALDTSDAEGCIYRARGRELLGRTGSLSRVDPRFLRVLPKVRTPPTGRPAFSRYACVQGPGIEARWYKIPARHRGTDLRSEYANLLLLPWPLKVRASDFRPLEGSVQRLTMDPYAFFEFAPAEGLDLDLLDRVLAAAREEVGSVDVVVLPESAIDERDIDDLEALLYGHGVISLAAGVRESSQPPGRFPGNWMHIGMNPRLQKGAAPPDGEVEPWFRIRQNKHHRWSLDQGQIDQYHLGGILHPHIRWWEAMEVPRRAIQFLEVAELTLATLVCEDLSQNGDIAELIRSVGPTALITVLLDGPQLNSRWAARYASVLADDPGSAVLTLSSFGMVQRSRPHDRDASRVIALWKDPTKGVREIPLEPGAQGVVLTICTDRGTRRSADGRWPVDNGISLFDAAVHQIQASSTGSRPRQPRSATPTAHVLETEEVTILTGWAEAVSEAAAHGPERIDALLAEGRAGAAWRAAMRLPEPSPPLAAALESLSRLVGATAVPPGKSQFDAMLAMCAQDQPGEQTLDGLVRRVLLAMLEERASRESTDADSGRRLGRGHSAVGADRRAKLARE
jgi:hypothetical protein